MLLIQRAGKESLLEEMPCYVFSKINHARVTAMCFSYASGKAVCTVWYSNEVNVIGHQAPSEKRYPETFSLLCKELEVNSSIVIGEEHRHRANPTLSDVMWNPWQYDTCDSGHEDILKRRHFDFK